MSDLRFNVAIGLQDGSERWLVLLVGGSYNNNYNRYVQHVVPLAVRSIIAYRTASRVQVATALENWQRTHTALCTRAMASLAASSHPC